MDSTADHAEIHVGIVVIGADVDHRYNARFRTDWPMLDSKFYELSADRVVIPAGKTVSDVVTLRLHDLMGQGEQQEGALPINETYLLCNC